MTRGVAGTSLALAFLLFGPQRVGAQSRHASGETSTVAEGGKHAPFVRKRGLTVGLGGGTGAILFTESLAPGDSGYGWTMSAHVGALVTSRLALLLEAYGMSRYFGDSLSVNQTIWALAAQYWMGSRFWTKIGIGMAHRSRRQPDGQIRGFIGTGVLGSAGYEMWYWRSFAFDLQLHVGAGRHKKGGRIAIQTALQVGINWY